MLRVHPAFLPRYAFIDVTTNGDRARLAISDCDALREGDVYNWQSLLGDRPHPALDAMVQTVNPRARCVPIAPGGTERLAWEIFIDPAAEPVDPPMEVAMVASTNTARFAFKAGRS